MVLAHQQDVIVDGLWHADHSAGDARLLALRLNGRRPGVAAVAAHDKDHVNRPHVYALHYLFDVCSTS